jgi:transketolase
MGKIGSSQITRLEATCRDVRRDIFQSVYNAGCGHLGGSLSSVEILVSLYFVVMNVDPSNPQWELRDRFVNSKGHSTAVYYSILANRGYFNRRQLVESFAAINSTFEEHGSVDVPGVDVSTGSLGQGLSIGAGMALSARWMGQQFNTYVLLGDGECQEGQIWEAALFASHYKLDNLVAIVDRNRLQVMGPTEEVLSIEPLEQKWKSFGWEVRRVAGHDLTALIRCLKEPRKEGRPWVVIADTVKGRGISFMENNSAWHSLHGFTEQELATVREELGIQ